MPDGIKLSEFIAWRQKTSPATKKGQAQKRRTGVGIRPGTPNDPPWPGADAPEMAGDCGRETIAQLNSEEDGGAIEAFGELRRLRINIIQEAVERSVGEQGRPVEQIGRGFNEATRAGWAGERKLEISVGE